MGGSAPRTNRRPPAQAPVETTSFVDRRTEQTEVRALLARARLVTLTGPGGVGKSRLAARAASRLTRAFPDGVRLVQLARDLGDVDDPDLVVPRALATALGLYGYDHPTPPEDPAHGRPANRDLLDVLADHLSSRRLLLILDNCEHLHRSCAELAAELLRRTTGVRILATSRHRLGLTEEHLLDVRPLPVPDPDGDLSAPHRHPALALFADRAAAAVPGFALTPANRATAAHLCRRLDGLPLAIELAASRMTDPADLNADELLAATYDDHETRTDAGPRHRTLWATIDRSHQLCMPEERLVWARASVLAGDFDLETAEAVCGEGVDDVLDAVTGLVGKSVLSREPGPDGGVRYRLLDTFRRYGLDRLKQRPGEERAARRRHRDWTQTRAASYEQAWFGPGQQHLAARLHADRANLRAALDFSLGADGGAPDDALAGLRLAGTLWFHWYACGAPGEGGYWLDRALAANAGPSRERARALWVSGLLGLLTGSAEDRARGRRRAEEARALARRLGDAAEAAHAEYVIGLGLLLGGEPAAALRHFEESVARGPVPGGHAALAGLERVQLACALTALGETDRALAVCENTLRVCEEYGEEWVRSCALRALALAHTAREDWHRAEPPAREALRIGQALHDTLGIAPTLDLLALIATFHSHQHQQGHQQGQGHEYEQHDHNHEHDPGQDRHPDHHHDHGHERAAVLLGGADSVRATPFDAVRQDAETRAREGLGRSRRAYERAYRRGNAFDLAAIVEYALGEGSSADRSPEPQASGLTRRETEVAALVAEGLANQQIADRLVIARRTAEGHVEHILGKLGFANRAQIAAWVATHH
ncbi:LuxR C-terminal-related transcriptional regulator [Streptomyces sp. ME02-8801-2C]|uniref:ATP-binding protein n=1 Tax=Streptomyces sp. ME02-8801-2C TaxID=3028680 RepID=UPI0029B338DD|nr:LuxR C-terminal-related transcriptional regulator [Streptomyces sp. ME02-8801-2C]MDX3456926.1 LuxR C-terminal-related transcriptional regulator [Streptomyces sp. ME02-8801-2C]